MHGQGGDRHAGRLEEAEADLQAAAGTVGGTLRVASLQTPLISLVPVAHRLLAERHPELRLEPLELEEDALPALALGELDASIDEEYDFAPRPVRDELVKEELGGDEVLVAVPPGHPAARRKGAIPLAALAGDAWINPYVFTRRSGRRRPSLEALVAALRDGASQYLTPPPPRRGAPAGARR
ncbi:MAG TPA: LysR substrate-binding domain-containing protein [Solirubrobacteraceae bacterium]|nr:LysR substrate-binding domain-containing protein [Solirubrobacteraceae bacterium]